VKTFPEMNSNLVSDPNDSLITRREAIRRTAMMLGVALTPSLLSGVLQAQTAASAGNAAPRFLSAGQFAITGAIAERILPKSDTPGARDVGVPAFLDLMYGQYMTAEEKIVFAAGLADIDSLSQTTAQRGFAQLSPAQQDAVLTKVAVAAQNQEKTFFHLIKELTLLGYFTSERIGKNVLHYDPIPGRYDGCIPLSDVGNRSWTR
jgi:gluconate 2-dehydrogenase gamma chain